MTSADMVVGSASRSYETASGAGLAPLLRPGDTCWKVARADRFTLIVDAASYFRRLRAAIKKAHHAVYLIGWDFDLRIEMLPGQSDDEGLAPDGLPNELGAFLKAVVRDRQSLELRILKWDGAMLAAVGKQIAPTLGLMLADERVHFALDSHHPVGACHHQKIVAIDDRLAFCGGIDVTVGRWDTRAHEPGDARRTDPDGDIHQPWHDVTAALEGPAARALADLARIRWRAATGETLDAPPRDAASPWPDDLSADLTDVEIAIARTEPRYHDDELVDEIERLYLAAIRAARRIIHIESQYLAAGSLVEALCERLGEPDGPEVIVINPRNAQSWLEDEAMHSVRARAIHRLREAAGPDWEDRLAVLHPVNADGEPIYVHAKVLTIDERLLRVGSSNIDNRSMGFDTECDVAFEAHGEEERALVAGFRRSLLAEHLDCTPDRLEAMEAERGSLLAAVRAVRRDEGRSLRAIEPTPLDPAERFLADSRLFDPRYYPRNRPRGLGEHLEHAGKRAIAPYHTQMIGGLGLAIGLGAIALGLWGGYRLMRGRNLRHRAPLAAPAIMRPNAPVAHRIPYPSTPPRSKG